MAQPYIGEIRMFAGNFEPNGWYFCDGRLLSIADFETLFYLIGTTYGGDGQTTFALPDLRGRIPIHMGIGPGLSNRVIGELGGSETVTITPNQLPMHTHTQAATSADADRTNPKNAVHAKSQEPAYATAAANAAMAATPLGSTGGTQPHYNLQPFLCVNFIISLFGIFPSQT